MAPKQGVKPLQFFSLNQNERKKILNHLGQNQFMLLFHITMLMQESFLLNHTMKFGPG